MRVAQPAVEPNKKARTPRSPGMIQSQFRAQHDVSPNACGPGAHTDPGIITIVLQNEVQGLQVRHGEEWVDVKPVPGGLIVNIGDFLQIVSNGEYKSVRHRVLANGNKEPRISIVTFFNLVKWREDGKYGPLPELLTPEKPAIYRDFTIEEFCENFYSKELDSKSFVQKTKL
ncbi:1-aminocyclopropane-1-carboxylate oxidase homolog 4 [Striga hermonthica]|uniref:1-aminocyclopropane-1-carboxylate oxidase homolog 4 n=1 Tax=Striga hermonthica TaxID=68872 RepID=A0A9N7NTM4_STRHE|nr:1-aminocyclopropane-1-carboxylate oxidase homolog 4 [Striga hermonthica]